jgi:hypothetical protein
MNEPSRRDCVLSPAAPTTPQWRWPRIPVCRDPLLPWRRHCRQRQRIPHRESPCRGRRPEKSLMPMFSGRPFWLPLAAHVLEVADPLLLFRVRRERGALSEAFLPVCIDIFKPPAAVGVLPSFNGLLRCLEEIAATAQQRATVLSLTRGKARWIQRRAATRSGRCAGRAKARARSRLEMFAKYGAPHHNGHAAARDLHVPRPAYLPELRSTRPWLFALHSSQPAYAIQGALPSIPSAKRSGGVQISGRRTGRR